jgi:outer membrane protein TolC
MLSLVPIVAIGLLVPANTDTVRTRWTVPQYLALVERSNPELTAARERVAAAQARVGPAGRPSDPMIEVELMNRSLPGFGKSSPVAMDQVRITQSIPAPGSLGAATSASQQRVTAEALQLEETRHLLRWRATTDLIELDRIDRTAALLETLGPALESLRNGAKARYAVGQAQQPDVIRAQLETTRLAEELIILRSERRAVLARLNAIALRPAGAPLDSVVLPIPPDSIPPVPDLVQRSLSNRPLLASRRASREAAAFDSRRARLERWPMLQVGLAYGQQPMFGASGTDRMLSVMVGANLPIWSGSRQRQMRREAEAMERMAAADVIAAEAETQARIDEVAAEADRASRLVTLYRSTLVPESRAAAASALASYRAGGVDFETVISAQLAIVRAEVELVRLAGERARAVAELEYLTAGPIGTGLEGGSQ